MTFVIHTHSGKDPGCYGKAHEFLRASHKRYAHAIVIFDREGCGKESQTRETLEAEVEERLARNGWRGRARVVVLEPELESWVWSDSPHVPKALGWPRTPPDLRSWLVQRGLLEENRVKPARPKEAMEAVLRHVRKPPSSKIFQTLAENVSLACCVDPAFGKLRTTLHEWFPAE